MRLEDLPPGYLFGGPGSSRRLSLPPDSGPVDLVAAVRAPDWEIWVAWLLGEDPWPVIERLPPARRIQWGAYVERWQRWAHRLPEGHRYAHGRWHWVSGAAVARRFEPGSALYVVSRGRLRMRIEIDARSSSAGTRGSAHAGLRFARRCDTLDLPPPLTHPLGCGCPVAWRPLTLERDVPSPRGMRRRWWPREAEIACPDWREAAEGTGGAG